MDGVVEKTAVIDSGGLATLIDVLVRNDYEVVAPRVENATIVYRPIADATALPRGISDMQDGGTYRLVDYTDGSLTAHVVGPDSPKRWFHPPRTRLFEAALGPDGDLQVRPEPVDDWPVAFLGIRPCELAAIARQDQILMGGRFVDDGYAARREGALLISFDCSRPGGTCFCASLGTGPKAKDLFDLALTEIRAGAEFLVRVGSEHGEALLTEIPSRAAVDADLRGAERIWAKAADSMGRSLQTKHLPEVLRDHQNSPYWSEIAKRCVACGNCTLVCPTCFCTTIEDGATLDGKRFARHQRWDTCFSLQFTYIHGAQARSSVSSRYRQWLTHKLSGWVEQFGELGCVGCGRCITWCPVGIDMTEEVLNFQQEPVR